MSYPLPPLSALRAFEAAARHLSLTRAAAELHVTPGALSHQIRGLEATLGVALFHRLPRALRLTEAGRRLLPGLSEGFAQLRKAVESIRPSTEERMLVISAPPGFTAKWLVPRLYRFLAARPEIDARVSATLANANFHDDGVDVAIRNMYPDGESDPDLLVEHLADLIYVPMCSPRLIARLGAPRGAADLARMPLIHDDMLAGRADIPDWPAWFARARLEGAGLEEPGLEEIDVSHGLRLNSADHALDAAAEGAGVLLGLELLARDDLRNGRLVVASDLRMRSRRAFHIVCPRSYARRANVQAFRDWIKAEMAAAIRGSD